MQRSGIHFHLLLPLLLLFAACKEEPQVTERSYSNGLFVVNEGNFQGGNASLSFLGRSGDSLYNDIFQTELERPLGDVAQSMTIVGNRAYVVVNNSGKIEGLNLPGLDAHCIVSGLTSPRYLLPIGGGIALASDLYASAIQVVNLENCSVVGQIPTGGWTEEMLLLGGKAYVVQTGTNQILRIHPTGPSFIDSTTVAREPNSLVADQLGRLWVLCGNALGTVQPHLLCLDPDSMHVLLDLPWPDALRNPTRLTTNAAADSLYWIDGGIWRMPISATALPGAAWVPAGSHTWYGLALDPRTGLVYATDALDYQRRGKLYRFSPNSNSPLAEWLMGVIPGEIAFVD